jgi:hypothetical protein
MITCPEVMDLISSYIDDEVSEIEKKSVEQHLRDCPECRKEYEYTLEVLNALKEIPDEELPQGFKEELHKKLETASREQTRGRVGFFNSPRLRVIAGIAACLFVVLIARDVLFNNRRIFKDNAELQISGEQNLLRAAGAEKAETTAAVLYEDSFFTDSQTPRDTLNTFFSEGLTEEETSKRHTPDEKGIESYSLHSSVYDDTNHIKVSITIDSSNPEKHMSQLESFAKRNGAVFSTVSDASNMLAFKIRKDRFADIQEYLINNYGAENVNYTSRVIEEPSFNIGELYDRYNELASRLTDEREATDTETLRIMAQKELLMDMIKALEEESESATVSVTFQETD